MFSPLNFINRATHLALENRQNDLQKLNVRGPSLATIMRYYDSIHNRLIYLSQQATADYWDDHWETGTSLQQLLQKSQVTYISRITNRYLQPDDGPILEGGCGTGQHVAALTHQGYTCIGVDYAEKTVEAIHEAAPALDVRLGDITNLAFDDATFAGYWSVGVIEHFWNGYAVCAAEMARVVRPAGYLFVTFPQLSLLRRWKARAGSYPQWSTAESTTESPDNFYQFALDHQQVARTFSAHGFTLTKALPLDGLKGFKDEMERLKAPLQKLYNYRGRSLPLRAMRFGLSQALAPLAGHSMLLIMQRLPLVTGTVTAAAETATGTTE